MKAKPLDGRPPKLDGKKLHRTLERGEGLVQKWLKTEYPKIKKAS